MNNNQKINDMIHDMSNGQILNKDDRDSLKSALHFELSYAKKLKATHELAVALEDVQVAKTPDRKISTIERALLLLQGEDNVDLHSEWLGALGQTEPVVSQEDEDDDEDEEDEEEGGCSCGSYGCDYYADVD